MKRKILSLILVFAMTVSLLTVGTGAVEPAYGDTAGHWAESSIERWSGHGIIQGSNGLFDPNGQLTCAQLATILAKLLKLPAAKDAGFTDNTADAWYYDAVNRCAAAGILNGNGDSTVTPEAPITRERAMVMLGRALGIEPIREPDLTKYTDAAKVAPYAQGMVAAMIEAGIVGGVTADELAPQDNINRASTVTIFDRAISTYADKAGETVKADGKGITLIVADDVTVTGDVDKLLVPADNVDVTVSGSKNIDDITVTGDNSKVILNNSTANDVTLDGKNTELETKGGSKVENVSVTEDAKGATVNAGSGTTVKNVENSAADTTVTGSGSVKNVASDTDVTVETKGTEVKNTGDGKITVTDKNGKDSAVNSGSSSTTTGGTTSGGSSSGSSGGSSHSHSYVYTDNGDGTHTGRCYTNDSTLAPEAHNIVDGKCTVCGAAQTAESVASVKAADGTCTYYPMLPGAVAAAADGATITLLNNVELSAALEISAGKTVTLDLNGKKLSTTTKTGDNTRHYYAIDNKGTFTLLDSSTEQTGEISARGIENLVGGKMVIKSGKIVAVDANGGAAIWNLADLTIEGGTFEAQYEGTSTDQFGPGCVYNEGNLTINGGTFTSANKRTYAFVSKMGSVTITPAGGKTVKISGAHGGLGIDGGTAIINGGNYSSSEYYGLYVSNDSRKANVTVNDGSFTGNNYSVWIGSDVKNPVDSKLTINGGTFNKPINEQNNAAGKLKVTGGTFSSDPNAYVADGYTVKALEGGKYQVVALFAGGSGTAEDPFVIENAEQFKAFRDNVNAGSTFAGKTIKLKEDINLNNETWTPIGTNEHPFSGSFDGQNHTVSNLKITSAGSYNGLFGKVVGITDGASYKKTAGEVWNAETYTLSNCDESQFKTIIKDFTIDGFSVTTGEYGAAAIGWAENAYVSNITVSNGSVTDAGAMKQGKVAAIVGVSARNMVYNQLVTANNVSVTGSKHTVAGIVSNVQRGNNNQPHLVVIKDCVNNAAVNWTTGGGTTGGLPIAGIVANAGSCSGLEVVIYKCTNNGTITAGECNYACGIVGQAGDWVKAIYGCHNTGNITAKAVEYGVAGICITGSIPAIACSNRGALTNSAEDGHIYDISSSISQLTIVNETFADVSALQERIKNAVGTPKTLILKDITVTNPTGMLTIPNGIQHISANTKVCGSISLPDALVNIDMIGLAQTVTGTVCRTFSGSGNRIAVEANTTIGDIVIAGTNNTFTNNGTMGNVAISGNGTDIVINNGIGATMAGMTMIDTAATATLNNYGTMNRTAGGHCVWVEASGTLTVNNHGSISAADNYALLFYGDCIIIVNAYDSSTVTHGFAPYRGAHTITVNYQPGARYEDGSWADLPCKGQYGVTVSKMQ